MLRQEGAARARSSLGSPVTFEEEDGAPGLKAGPAVLLAELLLAGPEAGGVTTPGQGGDEESGTGAGEGLGEGSLPARLGPRRLRRDHSEEASPPSPSPAGLEGAEGVASCTEDRTAGRLLAGRPHWLSGADAPPLAPAIT